MATTTEANSDNRGSTDAETEEVSDQWRLIKLLAYSIVITVIVIALYFAQLYSYLLFHSIIELVSIVIAFGVFIIGWNTTKFSKDILYLYLSVVYLFVGCVDLVHTLAYSGMNVFPGAGPNLPTELWIAGRYLASFSLLIAPFIFGRKISRGRLFAVFFIVTGVLLSSILVWDVFPDCFIVGSGLTPFKVMSEYAISGILVAAIILFYRKREVLDPEVLRLLILAMFVTIGSEMAFTLYTDVFGLTNMIGHYLKLVSFYLIYRALIHASLSRPYEVLFRDLKLNEQRVIERTIQLEATNSELESFSYSVSHDLRSPLSAIDGFSTLLLKKYADDLDDKGKHYLNRIRTGIQNMGTMIDDILALSQISRTEFHYEKVDLTQLSKEILNHLQNSNPERNVELVIEDGLTVRCDAGHLRVAMTNLLSNAWKFTSMSTNARIEVGKTSYNEQSVFYVRDNGAGFDMEYTQKLFTPFQRLHTESEFRGSGIGLATVQRIVNRHGGNIMAEGKVGDGATFYFTFEIGMKNNE